MKGVAIKTKYGLMFADMTDDWEDTPENRQKLIEEIENGEIGKIISERRSKE